MGGELPASVGPELHILGHATGEDLRRVAVPMRDEAIQRMRRGQVIRQPGFDGQYGVIRLFRDGELPARKKSKR